MVEIDYRETEQFYIGIAKLQNFTICKEDDEKINTTHTYSHSHAFE